MLLLLRLLLLIISRKGWNWIGLRPFLIWPYKTFLTDSPFIPHTSITQFALLCVLQVRLGLIFTTINHQISTYNYPNAERVPVTAECGVVLPVQPSKLRSFFMWCDKNSQPQNTHKICYHRGFLCSAPWGYANDLLLCCASTREKEKGHRWYQCVLY